MKLKTLRIRNFRCYEYIEIDVDSMHALVGSNNAGKSTILHALDFLFNPSTKKINEESFYLQNSSLRIEVEALFIDLTDAEREQLGANTSPDGAFRLRRTAQMSTDGEDASGGDDDGHSKVTIAAEYCKPQPKLDWLNSGQITGESISPHYSPACLRSGRQPLWTAAATVDSPRSWGDAA